MIPSNLTNFRSLTLENTGVVVKSIAGVAAGVLITNTNTVMRFIKLYDKATAPTAADTPVMSIGVPGNTTLPVPISGGLQFLNGIGARGVTEAADAGTTSNAAGEVITEISY